MASAAPADPLTNPTTPPAVHVCEVLLQSDDDVEDNLVDAETLAARQNNSAQKKPSVAPIINQHQPTVDTVTRKLAATTITTTNATAKPHADTTTDDDASSSSSGSSVASKPSASPVYKTDEVNNPVTGVYDEIEIEDMEYDTKAKIYTYPCPCGDRFGISVKDLFDGEDIARCPSCSLIIRVIYDDDLLDELEEQQNDADD